MHGLSTRKVDDLVAGDGRLPVSKSEVSRICARSTMSWHCSGTGPWTTPPTPTSGSTRRTRRCARVGGL